MQGQHPQVGDVVRLRGDVPDLSLRRGDTGVVCSRWFAPVNAYEVEFASTVGEWHVHAIVMEPQLQLEGSECSTESC